MSVKQIKLTARYNHAIEGRPVSRFYCTIFNQWLIDIKLSKPFAGRPKGAILTEPESSLIIKSSIRWTNKGLSFTAKGLSQEQFLALPVEK